ncbi:MAG: HAD family hydrolase [Verrucomicrobiales bacterium]|nr:HAD family hydrolase [Verrucomicrobiales bacterium]
MPAEKLLLFDIDGTLIDTEGAGLYSLAEGFFNAFPEFQGKPFPALDLGGATDGSVVAFLFESFGIEDHEEHRTRFFAAYSVALEEKLGRFEREGKGRLLEGVPSLLEELRGGDHPYHIALLTGNTCEGAGIKLRHYGIDHHFSFGAYGDDHPDRNALGPVALKRAEEVHGLGLSPENVVIIGDTPKDIACARAFGARVIAVATGGSSEQDLRDCAPDFLLSSLSDTAAVIAALAQVFTQGET